MEYRLLGNTLLKVSLMGFGGIPIQRVSSAEAERIINVAVEQGINFIDTARAYTDSESKIGLALKDKRDKVVLATKSMSRSKEKMQEDIDASLSNLATDYIDLYQCHNIKTHEELDRVMAPGGAMEALEDAKKAGKIGHIGVTGHIITALQEIIETQRFATLQVPYNFIERGPEELLLPTARKLGMGIIIMKPLAGGAYSRPDLALRFLLQKDITTIIPGVDCCEQVIQNSDLAKARQPLTESEVEYLTKEANEVGNRFCRRCEYCKPCPQGVDIPTCFLVEGYYTRYNLTDWAKQRYEGLSVKADACIECGICETRCPYNLPIREMLQNVHRYLG